MYTTKIQMINVDDVKRFVTAANNYDFEIDLTCGRYTVDGKSIMGIFSLDLSKEIQLTASQYDEKFIEEIKDFIVK